MSERIWADVDRYLAARLIPADPALDAALAASDAAGLPAIQVAPLEGKLLQLLARSVGARAVLEIGTLGGYSTIWLARALPPGGRLVTLEADPRHAEVATENVRRAGLGDVVTLHLGRALDTLPRVAAEATTAFDLVFIDADKVNIPAYFEWALRLTRPGSLVVVDNVVRGGAVADEDTTDENVRGVQRFLSSLAGDPRVDVTAIQTVGAKGYDGFALALVR